MKAPGNREFGWHVLVEEFDSFIRCIEITWNIQWNISRNVTHHYVPNQVLSQSGYW